MNELDLMIFERNLIGRGWKIEYGRRNELIAVSHTAPFNCADGRNPQKGPTLFGGLWGVMALATGGTPEGAQQAKANIAQAGFTPGVHGDHHGRLGCRFYGLWERNSLSEIHPKEFTDAELPQILDGVQQIILPDEHKEKLLVVNFVEQYTVNPKTDRFRVDAWLGTQLGIPPDKLLSISVATVQQLSDARTIRFIR